MPRFGLLQGEVMFHPGDLVRYGGFGVCKVEEKKIMEMAKVEEEYYVLSPMFKSGVLYVPCANEELVGRMLPLLTPEEIFSVVEKVKNMEIEWIRDFRRRSEKAKKALNSGDRADALFLIKNAWAKRVGQITEIRRTHTTDDYFLRDAELLIFNEFSFVLEKSVEEVTAWVRNEFGMKEKTEK
jgi:CarD family transcriptional regulator